MINCVCGYCGNREQVESVPSNWVVPASGLETDALEDGKNPLGAGTVKAFCSEACEKTFRQKFYQAALFAGKQ